MDQSRRQENATAALVAVAFCLSVAGCEPAGRPTTVAAGIALLERTDRSGEIAPDRADSLPFAGSLLDPVAWDTVAGVDYTDPTLRGLIPLVRVAGREAVALSDNLSLGDFAASDGASFVRVSDRLVSALEAIMAKVDQRVQINSGYRHMALNARSEINGAARSMHMAGMAADIWTHGMKPIELAKAILDTVGCTVGLGLGKGFVHVDLRGRLASWATADAAFSEEEFDRWVWYQCTGRDQGEEPDETILAILRQADETAWTAEKTSHYVEGKDFQQVLSAYARLHLQRNGKRGAVAIDFRVDPLKGRPNQTEYALSLLPGDISELVAPGLSRLLAQVRPGYFAYVLIQRDNSTEIGIMPLAQPSPAQTADAAN